MAVATNSHRNYIAGEWIDSESGERFDNRNPATGELLGSFPRSTKRMRSSSMIRAPTPSSGWEG